MEKKKVCIVGRGSIGTRHAKILENLGYKVYFLRRKKNENCNNEISQYRDLNSYNFKFYFICNPSSLHISVVKKIYKFDKNRNLKFFIEKPIVTNINDFLYLKNLIKKNKKKVFIYSGYMLRHDPGIINIRRIIKNNPFKIRYAKFNWQTYMPSWHPWENYKKSYASQKKYGGGVLFTCSHEIDISILLFGKAKQVFCTITKSKLKTDVENSVFLIIKHANNITSYINLDFACKAESKRNFEIIFDNYSIMRSFNMNNYSKHIDNFKKVHKIKKKIIDHIYKTQIKSFLNLCNERKILTKNYYKNFLETEKVIFAAKKSILNKRFIKI